jgi:2,3-bisphosphoglycerate-independent phosphoglycerate mutase
VAGEERPSKRWAPSASSWAAVAGGGVLRTFRDVEGGRAATFDITGELLRSVGIAAPRRTVKEAARAIAAGAAELDVALFELFLTDEAGHSQNVDFARSEILRTDQFLTTLFDAIDPREQLVVVTSDHGNLEDLSTRSHTRAAVPLVARGAGAAEVIAPLGSLKDLTPAILRAAG